LFAGDIIIQHLPNHPEMSYIFVHKQPMGPWRESHCA